ncbi:MAG: hypothetical protein SFV23_07005 [Planctomycetaceae bacterium]|nr:hypothetical protein [Planctomycetaceae bacterium]
MRAITPHLGDIWSHSGFLYDADDRASLGEDMYAAWRADGTTIDAGWSQEGNPHGCYVITVQKGFDDVGPPFQTDNLEEAVAHVESVAAHLSGNLPVISPEPLGKVIPTA